MHVFCLTEIYESIRSEQPLIVMVLKCYLQKQTNTRIYIVESWKMTCPAQHLLSTLLRFLLRAPLIETTIYLLFLFHKTQKAQSLSLKYSCQISAVYIY